MLLQRRRSASLPDPLPQWPSYRQVRRFCRHVVKALGVKPPFAVTDLCREVGAVRGRPILVEYRVLTPGFFGFSFPSDELRSDLVIVAANTTRPHQEHIMLHELGHILAGHLQLGASTAQAHRTTDDAAKEREWVAESIATVLSERAVLDQLRFGDRPTDPESLALDEALRSGKFWI